MFYDGYKYWFAFKTDKTSYYRCSRYISSKCLGKCIIDENGKIKHTAEHNHPPEPNRALIDKFRKTLTHRSATENTEFYQIYCDESNRHVDAALLYPFTSAESAMRKARRKQLPKSPNSVKDVIDVLDHNKDLFRVHCGSDKDSLYQKTITLDDCVCMIFMHRKTFDIFSSRIEEVHIDGSFEFVIQNHPNYYLMTFHAVQGAMTAPIIYSVSTAKSQSACSSIFAYIRDELKIRPNMIISDFDPVMQTALSYIFPDTILKGCWFHYTDAVLSQMKSLNLPKETAKGIGASALRMLLVLPLLPPEYMVPGLDAARKWMKEKTILSDGLSNLCDYIEHGWLRAVGTKKMSIFGTTRIVSNHLKTFNKELSDTIGKQNPVIWVILDSLTQLATKIYVKTCRKIRTLKAAGVAGTSGVIGNISNDTTSKQNSFVLGTASSFETSNPTTVASVKPLKRSELISETVISSATQVWIKTPVHLRNPLQFLQLISHCINDSMYLGNMSDIKERNYLPIISTSNTVTPISSCPINTSSTQTTPETVLTPSTCSTSVTSVTSQSFSTSWNNTSQDVLQNCDSPLQDLQNAPSSPSLSVILQESTFSCSSITHQEFLLAQPGQALLDSQQNNYTSCFAQNRFNNNNDLSNNHHHHDINLQQNHCQTQHYFNFNSCHSNNNNSNTNSDCQEANQKQTSCQIQQNQHQTQQIGNQQSTQNSSAATNIFHSSEPPPLVFFSSVKRLPCKRILPVLSEPPPLVPISSSKHSNVRNKINGNSDISNMNSSNAKKT